MDNPLDFPFVDKTVYKITYYGPGRTKADAVTQIMRYQQSDTFEQWHYTFSHPLQMTDGCGFTGPHISAGECGIRSDEFVSIEPVTPEELALWQQMTRDKIARYTRRYGGDPCAEDVSTAVAYTGPAAIYQ